MRETPSMSEFYYNTAVTMLDLVMGKTYFSPAREGRYKGKHDMGRPDVSSIFTTMKNGAILTISIGVTYGCYFVAWVPLFFENDAGAFFTDCMTMWTMYVFFF